MTGRKKCAQALLRPPTGLILLLALISAAGLTYVFVTGLEKHPAAYALYGLSCYTLLVFCVFCCKTVPPYYLAVKQKVLNHPYANRYVTDVAYRTHISLYASLGVNLLYVVVNLFSGVLYRTYWFMILAGYYAILAVMRFLLVRYIHQVGIKKDLLGEWKRSRLCACILTLTNFSLTGVVLMILYQDRGFVYWGILIYVMALYAFYTTTHAIIQMVTYRKYQSPVLSTTKIISLTAALVCMLSLETAMFNAFGTEMSAEHKKLFIALTGAGISVVVVTLSVYWIVRSTKAIKTLKTGENNV